MKYWNKDKNIRQRCWTKVTTPKTSVRTELHNGAVAWWPFIIPRNELKRWCQQQASTGKFYFYYGSDTWWFERPEDAVWFSLSWA